MTCDPDPAKNLSSQPDLWGESLISVRNSEHLLQYRQTELLMYTLKPRENVKTSVIAFVVIVFKAILLFVDITSVGRVTKEVGTVALRAHSTAT